MTAKEKATELIKISFEKIAKTSNYKGIQKDGGKLFYIIEDLSKKIAKDYIKIILEELNNTSCFQEKTKYWNDVILEIDTI